VVLDLSKHGTMAALSGKTVLIKGYDSEAQCYRACAESLVLTVERSQIARVLFDERDVGSGVQWRFRIEDTTRPRRRGPPNSRMAEQAISGPTRGEAEPFHGIPDGSLEFQVLGELVRIHTRRRLGATKEELSGRVQLSGGEAPPPGSERNVGFQHSALPDPRPHDQQGPPQQAAPPSPPLQQLAVAPPSSQPSTAVPSEASTPSARPSPSPSLPSWSAAAAPASAPLAEAPMTAPASVVQ
jgi:hypothetical protein